MNDNQKSILFNSFLELQPYIKTCYITYHRCINSKLEHISIVFNFVNLDLSLISDECKLYWKLEGMQKLFDKIGFPPIMRTLPKNLIKLLFNDTTQFCYNNCMNL